MNITQKTVESDIAPLTCSICHQVKPDDLNACGTCGDLICGRCPAYACSCVNPRLIGKLCAELRAAAIELEDLKAIAYLIGADTLSTPQRARLLLLTDVVRSLINEINLLDDDENGEFYDA